MKKLFDVWLLLFKLVLLTAFSCVASAQQEEILRKIFTLTNINVFNDYHQRIEYQSCTIKTYWGDSIDLHNATYFYLPDISENILSVKKYDCSGKECFGLNLTSIKGRTAIIREIYTGIYKGERWFPDQWWINTSGENQATELAKLIKTLISECRSLTNWRKPKSWLDNFE